MDLMRTSGMDLMRINGADSASSLNDLSMEELQVIQEQIIGIRMKRFEVELEKTKNLIEKQRAELDIMKEEAEVFREVELKRHRVAEHRFGFVSLSDLGQCYEVSIGSKTMGNLLRLAGIAKAKQSKTEPYRDAIVNKYAKSQMYGDNVTYQWNPEKCIEKIDKWLESVGEINNFYAVDDEDRLREFINNLADTYGQS